MTQPIPQASLLAALEFQIALGADEAILGAPLDRFALSAEAAARKRQAAAASSRGASGWTNPFVKDTAKPAAARPQIDAIGVARTLAEGAESLSALRVALEGFEHCELKKGARSLVFADGNPEARVMIIGEAPGRDEDIQGLPFVGRAGQLLDRMFAAIGLSRRGGGPGDALYITNILPWRPPQNRDPAPDEMAMMKPFVERHVALARPDVLVLMGNISCQAMLGRRGITRLRGHWAEVLGRPALPMFHPAYLLRTPSAKRAAWADLLELQARLRQG